MLAQPHVKFGMTHDPCILFTLEQHTQTGFIYLRVTAEPA